MKHLVSGSLISCSDFATLGLDLRGVWSVSRWMPHPNLGCQPPYRRQGLLEPSEMGLISHLPLREKWIVLPVNLKIRTKYVESSPSLFLLILWVWSCLQKIGIHLCFYTMDFTQKKRTNTTCNWELGNLFCSGDQCPWIHYIYIILRALEAIKLMSCYLLAQQCNELRLGKKSSVYSWNKIKTKQNKANNKKPVWEHLEIDTNSRWEGFKSGCPWKQGVEVQWSGTEGHYPHSNSRFKPVLIVTKQFIISHFIVLWNQTR